MKPQFYIPTGGAWDIALSVLNVRRRLGYWPNYRKPRTFNEYFLSEKVNFSGDLLLARTLTDKIDIKDWLNRNGLSDYVIPTTLIAESTRDLRDKLLPSRCVLKPAHSSGDLIIINCAAARSLTIAELAKVNAWLGEDYYRRGREPNYAGLKPRVIVEELILDDSGLPPKDYKIECAYGQPFMIQVDINRFTNHVRQLYTTDWQLLPYCTSYPRYPVPQPPPRELARALEIAKQLSGPFRLCRIDLYLLGDGDIRIGEVTFFPANCAETFEPSSGDAEAGSLIANIYRRQE